MAKKLIAAASIQINASSERVWEALIKPHEIQQYMFGTQVRSDWHKGSTITWKGEWQGRAYEDKGKILQLEPRQRIQYSHFSPLSGVPDKPENYHIVTVELSPDGNQTLVSLTQDNNASEEERAHSEENWVMMLASLKKFLEQPRVQTPEQMPEFNPALQKLSKLVGEWKLEAIWGESRLAGHASFEWIEHGGFLMEHWDFLPSELPPAGTWIMGSDESTETISVLYYDSRSVSRTLQMSMEEDTWIMWRNDPGFSQRMTGKFSADGNTIHVNIEKSFDTEHWMHDFDVIYTRVA